MNDEMKNKLKALVAQMRAASFSEGFAAASNEHDRQSRREKRLAELQGQFDALLTQVERTPEGDDPATYIIGFPGGEYTEIKDVWVTETNSRQDTLRFYSTDPKRPAKVAAMFQPGSWAWFGKKDTA